VREEEVMDKGKTISRGALIMKKKTLYFVGGIILGIAVVIFIAAYIFIGSPKDLGVKYSKADLESANKKLGVQFLELNGVSDPKESLKMTGKKEVNTVLTGPELTALMNYRSDSWKYYPASDVQMKVNDDGSVELSGRLNSNLFVQYSEATDMPEKYRSFIADKIKLSPIKPAFYIKGAGEISNGKVATGEITSAKIGAISLPVDWFKNNDDFVKGFVEDRILKAGITAQSVRIEGGALSFKGSVPESVAAQK
jgi:hypothetical protein